MTVQPRVNFSLKKEVFFITLGSILGGFTMFVPNILFDVTVGTQYYVTWLVFAKIIGSHSIGAGIALHVIVATIIGIVTGIILYKGKILNISKISNGIIFGFLAGIVAFTIFFMPVYQLLLAPNMIQIMTELNPNMSVLEASDVIKQNYLQTLVDSIFKHLIWGVTLGVISTLLTRKFGTHYRCHVCDIEFSKIKTYEHHQRYVHESPSPSLKHILILGGGFSGVEVLKKVQDVLEDNVNINISLVSEDNFFLFTPMLPEVSSGMIESRHITTPIRTFCRRAKFYEAKVDSIDLKNKSVTISRLLDMKKKEIKYDYLVLALGSKTNYFGNKNLERYALTIKTLADAMAIRNHILSMFESADQEDDTVLKEKLLTFVVVGGGFSGVETVGEINDFIRESAEHFYRSIDPKKIRIILVSSGPRILPEAGDELGDYAVNFLSKAGIEILTNTKVLDVGKDFVLLDNKTNIPCNTLIWAGGVAMDPVVSSLECEHDKLGRVVVDEYLCIKDYPNVFALGDCAFIMDTASGKPCPPTAQHAIQEAKIVSENLISSIKGAKTKNVFNYKSKGTMAIVGKRTGVAILMGHKVKGLLAWFIWRQYYLARLPSSQKKIRVTVDWILDLFSKRDVTRLRNLKEKINDDVLETLAPDIRKLS